MAKMRCEEIYEMEEIIGEGTFSSVVRGIHNKTSEAYAIKIIDKTKIENSKQLMRIYNEIALHRRCSENPHITRFVEYYETDIDVCIVMELCRGGELFDSVVQNGKFSEKDANIALRQLLKAIDFMHSMGIVHRDIKPENILYSTRGKDAVIKLADFGLAKELEISSGRSLLKSSLSGTPAYCAPERLNMEKESKAVDMWSIGCILYFLLYGVPPFYSEKEDEDENEDEIFDSVLEGTVLFPESAIVSDSAKDLIMKLLEKDPSKRITSENALCHDWIKSFARSHSSHSLSPSETSLSSEYENGMVSDMDEMDLDSEDKGKSDSIYSSCRSNISSNTCTTNDELKNSINRIIDVQQEKDHADEQDAQ